MAPESRPEPWLRGTLSEVNPIARQVLHALELTGEDIARWCAPLTDIELEAKPFGLEPAGFHLRHIARSLDRLLTYAEARQLSDSQFAQLRSELHHPMTRDQILSELQHSLDDAALRIRALAPVSYMEPREVGRSVLPSTVAGLLIHCAEHTQRHTGQAVTTAKLLLALRHSQSGT